MPLDFVKMGYFRFQFLIFARKFSERLKLTMDVGTAFFTRVSFATTPLHLFVACWHYTQLCSPETGRTRMQLNRISTKMVTWSLSLHFGGSLAI